MDERNCLSDSIPSLQDLLNTKLNEENLNIDDGLSTQDENLFRIASMVFLQKQLKKKLGINDPSNANSKTAKVYSDMLLFEIRSGEHRERFYIRLKNCEKFDSIKNSETNTPEVALSKHQLLPLAKKPRLTFSRIFKLMSRNYSKENQKKRALTNKNSTRIDTLVNTNNPSIENRHIVSYISIESTGQKKVNYNEDWADQIKTKCSQNKPDTHLLRSLSSLSNVSLKKSISEHLRSRPSELSISTKPENFSSTCDTVTKFETPKVQKATCKLKRQQSKLSVCIEDETESENEFSKELFSKISYSNFPDDVKANLSPEVLQNIISQMIVYLEQTPENTHTS